jgi:ribosomal-protein-alanine N-acetyltransferase
VSTVLKMVELTHGAASDVPTVDAIMRAAFDPKYGEAWTQGQCLGVMVMPGVWLTLAHVDEKPAGFALSRAVAGEAELLLLATHPKQRRKGVGSALLRSVIDEARGRRAERLHLEMRAGNEATALYAAHGFAQVGTRKAYYRGGDGKMRDAQTWARDL